jgi:ribosomal 50S subunit-recycling heat shock protein
MRLDLFLKASRLVMRRTLAQEMCEAGVVLINDLPAKSSRTVNVGDRITVRRPNRVVSVRVLEVPASKQTSRSDAANLYQVLSDAVVEDSFT